MRVSLSLFFSGSINFILSNPLILINSSIKSTSCVTSGLHEGTSIFKIFLLFLHLNPKDDKILTASGIVIDTPIKFLNFSILNTIILFF